MPIWILLILLLTPVSILAQQESSPPSLAELARKERERRARSQKEVPVITNATLKQALRGQVSAPGNAPQEEGEEEAQRESSDGAAQSAADQAAALEASFTQARLDLETAVTKGRVLELKMNELRGQYYSQSNGVTQGRLQEQLQQLQLEIQANQQEVEAARAALQQLEQQARRDGVPPGAIRRMTADSPQD